MEVLGSGPLLPPTVEVTLAVLEVEEVRWFEVHLREVALASVVVEEVLVR